MTFTVASFNICSSHFMTGQYTRKNLMSLVTAVKDSGADVICLQEVDRGCTRSLRVDMTKELSELAGFQYSYFIKIRDFQGGEYGTAILSVFPIVKLDTIDYKVKTATQGTSCGYVVLNKNGSEFTVFNTHLSCESDEANTETMCCLGDILDEYGKSGKNFICCGDFNTNPDKISKYIPLISYANKGLLTYADRSIDNILYKSPVRVFNLRTVDTTSDMTTDHNMLLCEISI